jgi:hypothetical protein
VIFRSLLRGCFIPPQPDLTAFLTDAALSILLRRRGPYII